MSDTYVPRLATKYQQEVRQALQKEFAFANPMQIPRLQKIVINVSIKDALRDVKLLEHISGEITLIAGQKALIRKARKSIANFKLREGMPIGTAVTLRRQRMWEFLDRLISIALPQVRDFRGVSRRAFDGRGNYSMGLNEQLIFPEISYDDIKKVTGMSITFVTTARNDAEGLALLRELGMPFRKN